MPMDLYMSGIRGGGCLAVVLVAIATIGCQAADTGTKASEKSVVHILYSRLDADPVKSAPLPVREIQARIEQLTAVTHVESRTTLSTLEFWVYCESGSSSGDDLRSVADILSSIEEEPGKRQLRTPPEIRLVPQGPILLVTISNFATLAATHGAQHENSIPEPAKRLLNRLHRIPHVSRVSHSATTMHLADENEYQFSADQLVIAVHMQSTEYADEGSREVDKLLALFVADYPQIRVSCDLGTSRLTEAISSSEAAQTN